MKCSRKEIYSRVHKVPEIKFEDQKRTAHSYAPQRSELSGRQSISFEDLSPRIKQLGNLQGTRQKSSQNLSMETTVLSMEEVDSQFLNWEFKGLDINEVALCQREKHYESNGVSVAILHHGSYLDVCGYLWDYSPRYHRAPGVITKDMSRLFE